MKAESSAMLAEKLFQFHRCILRGYAAASFPQKQKMHSWGTTGSNCSFKYCGVCLAASHTMIWAICPILQILSSSLRLDELQWTQLPTEFQLRFKFRLGHSSTVGDFFRSHLSVVLTECLQLLSYWGGIKAEYTLWFDCPGSMAWIITSLSIEIKRRKENMSDPPRPEALSWDGPWVDMLSAWEDELWGDNCSCLTTGKLPAW